MFGKHPDLLTKEEMATVPELIALAIYEQEQEQKAMEDARRDARKH